MTAEERKFTKDGILERMRNARTGVESAIHGFEQLRKQDKENEGQYALMINMLSEADEKIVMAIFKSGYFAMDCGTPIQELGLSVRSWRCLVREGIETVEELATMTVDELKKVRNLGARSLIEITEKMEDIEMPLRKEGAK